MWHIFEGVAQQSAETGQAGRVATILLLPGYVFCVGALFVFKLFFILFFSAMVSKQSKAIPYKSINPNRTP